MQAAVEHVRSSLQGKRNDTSYMALYEKATTLIDSIDSIEVTHSRRFAGKAVDHYRVEFFNVLARLEVQFSERFDQESLKILQKVESALLTGQIDDALAQYPELNRASLSVQLPLFRSKYPYSSSEEAAKILRAASGSTGVVRSSGGSHQDFVGGTSVLM